MGKESWQTNNAQPANIYVDRKLNNKFTDTD
jgi:hypothetical protein